MCLRKFFYCFGIVLPEHPSLKLRGRTCAAEKTHLEATRKSSLHILHGCCASCNYITSLNSSLTKKLIFTSTSLPYYYWDYQTSHIIGDFPHSTWKTHIPYWNNLGYHFNHLVDRSKQWYMGAIQVTVPWGWLWAWQSSPAAGPCYRRGAASCWSTSFLPAPLLSRPGSPSPDSFPLCKLSFSSSFSTKGCKGVSASFWLQAAGSNKWGQTGGSWRSLVIARQSVVTAPQVGSSNSPHWSKSDFIPFSKSQFFSGCLFNRGSKLWNTCHCWYETIFKVMNISAHSQDLSLPTELSANRAILGAVWYPAESVNPCFAFLDAPVHPSRYQISIL